ncbi:MAG: glycosyltransferase family 9 protein, partial [Armatimonadetes bacterium]|nr:glycosyltransferase family 9 protein [Armatimonadota bacterium]
SPTAEPLRVLMVRLDGLGDTVLTTPLLRALREAGHEVTVIASPLGAQVLHGHPGVSALIVHDPRTSTLREKIRLSGELRGRFDAALTVTEKMWGYLWCNAAPTRIGFWAGAAQPVKAVALMGALTHRIPVQPVETHEVERIMLLGAPLGVAGPPGPLWLGIDLPERRDDAVAFHLSPKWLRDGCDHEWVRSLVEALGPVRISAGPSEAAWADALLASVPGAERIPTGSFADWCRGLASCRLLITTDTGASHVGAACGLPVVDLFSSEGAEHAVPRWKPWGVPSQIVLRAPGEARRAYEEILGASRNPSLHVR